MFFPHIKEKGKKKEKENSGTLATKMSEDLDVEALLEAPFSSNSNPSLSTAGKEEERSAAKEQSSDGKDKEKERSKDKSRRDDDDKHKSRRYFLLFFSFHPKEEITKNLTFVPSPKKDLTIKMMTEKVHVEEDRLALALVQDPALLEGSFSLSFYFSLSKQTLEEG